MNREEYNDYESKVKAFFAREGIVNLSPSVQEEEKEECPICGECYTFEPFFSWEACECCGSRLGGDRYHCLGYCPEAKQVFCYDICVDCMYYAEYGCLDDMTLLEIEEEVTQMKSKHTKEPWFFDEDETSYVFRAQGYHNGLVRIDIVWDDFCGDVVAKANAQRIVQCVNACAGLNPIAVPDMLEVCNAIRDTLVFIVESCIDIEDARDKLSPYVWILCEVIAKAEGGK